MRLLLDTNVFLRLMDDRPLPKAAERALDRHGVECFVSILTGWEIALRPMLRLTSADVEAGIAALGARTLPVRFTHLAGLAALPVHIHHKDPFDRLLIAQAIAEDMQMLSSDSRFAEYSRLKLIWD
jgi:PIN domain nuclease of toxin-antitoxin system